jgi:hypothetical protein
MLRRQAGFTDPLGKRGGAAGASPTHPANEGKGGKSPELGGRQLCISLYISFHAQRPEGAAAQPSRLM